MSPLVTLPESRPARRPSSHALLRRVALEDGLELEREVDRAARVVDARRREAAAGEVALPRGAHALDAVALGGLVEGADEVVEPGDRLFGRHRERELLEPDDVGEDHRDVVAVLGDRVVAVLVAARHALGHEREDEALVRPLLLLDEVRLDLEAAAHVVEGGRDVGELVARAGVDLDALLAGGDPLRGGLEPAQRPHEDLREHEREQADEDDHAGGREDEVAREVLDGHERLGRGLLRDDDPVQSVDAERGVGREAVATEVVALEQRAVLARERARHGLAR